MDELRAGQRVLYNLFFLTAGADKHTGSIGNFIVQLEGEMATTAPSEMFVYAQPRWWHNHRFDDIYIGKLQKIRITALTTDGWFFRDLLLFYARGAVWAYTDLWVQTDGHKVIEITSAADY